MAEEQHNVDINIRSTADGKGFEQAKAATQDLGKVAQKARQDEDQGTQEAIEGKRALKEAVHELSGEFPLLGQAANLVFNPMTAAIGVAIGAFGALQRALVDLQETMKPAVWEPLTKALELQGKTVNSSREAAALFADELDRLKNAQDTATEAAERNIDVIKKEEDARLKLADASEQAAKKQLDARAKTQGLSDEQVARERLAIENKFQSERLAIEKKARDDSVQERFAEAAKLRAETERLTKEIADNRKKIEITSSNEVLEHQLEAIKKNLADEEERNKKLQATIRDPLRGTIGEAALEREIEQSDALVENLKRQLGAHLDLVPQREIENKLAAAALAENERNLRTTVSRSHELQTVIRGMIEENRQAEALGRKLDEIRKGAQAPPALQKPLGPTYGTKGLPTEFSGTAGGVDPLTGKPTEFAGTAAPGTGLAATVGHAAQRPVPVMAGPVVQAVQESNESIVGAFGEIINLSAEMKRHIEELRAQIKNLRPAQ